MRSAPCRVVCASPRGIMKSGSWTISCLQNDQSLQKDAPLVGPTRRIGHGHQIYSYCSSNGMVHQAQLRSHMSSFTTQVAGRSVKGTYCRKGQPRHERDRWDVLTTTPITLSCDTFPSASLDTCQMYCECVPTGMNILPGWASCSIRAEGIVGAAAPTWIASYRPVRSDRTQGGLGRGDTYHRLDILIGVR